MSNRIQKISTGCVFQFKKVRDQPEELANEQELSVNVWRALE